MQQQAATPKDAVDHPRGPGGPYKNTVPLACATRRPFRACTTHLPPLGLIHEAMRRAGRAAKHRQIRVLEEVAVETCSRALPGVAQRLLPHLAARAVAAEPLQAGLQGFRCRLASTCARRWPEQREQVAHSKSSLRTWLSGTRAPSRWYQPHVGLSSKSPSLHLSVCCTFSRG